jgi:hypothetical protein
MSAWVGRTVNANNRPMQRLQTTTKRMRKLGQAQQQRREEYRPAWHTPQIREVENRSRFSLAAI